MSKYRKATLGPKDELIFHCTENNIKAVSQKLTFVGFFTIVSLLLYCSYYAKQTAVTQVFIVDKLNNFLINILINSA